MPHSQNSEMARHNDTGKKGETLAAAWLVGQGFHILHRNWREGRYEIDFIAEKDCLLHFIEVKTATTSCFGYPEQRIGRRKWKTWNKCSEGFLQGLAQPSSVRFDALSIMIRQKEISYCFFEDIFFY